MKKVGCAKCGGTIKKMAKGGSMKTTVGGPAKKPFAAGIPYATGAGYTDGKNGVMKLGGAAKAKLAGMAAPKNKITRADIIVAIKKKAKKK